MFLFLITCQDLEKFQFVLFQFVLIIGSAVIILEPVEGAS